MTLRPTVSANQVAAADLPIGEIAASFTWLGPDAPRFVSVQAARGDNRGLPTLVSWWLARETSVSDLLVAELRLQRERLARYRRVLDDLRALVPAAVPAKGFSAAAWYPDGLTREMADIDLVVPTAADVWTCGAALRRDGWSTGTSYVWRAGGRTQLLLVMKRPAAHPDLTARDRVEITTVAYEGDRVRVPPRSREWTVGALPSVADCVLWLLQESRDQAVRMRDMFDLAVFYARATPADTDAIAAMVAEYGANRPLRALIPVAARHLPAAADWLRDIQRRAGRGARPWWMRRSPAATLLAVAGEARRSPRALVRGAAGGLLANVQRWRGFDRLLAAGIPMLGMPIDGVALDSECVRDDEFGGAQLVVDGGRAHLRTPVGRFVLTSSNQICEDWLADFPDDSPPPDPNG